MSDQAIQTLEETVGTPPFKTWLCVLCGLVYSERDGWPDDGIPPGTRWEDVSGGLVPVPTAARPKPIFR
ncbi:rubredoxin [Rhizobium yanglingense]